MMTRRTITSTKVNPLREPRPSFIDAIRSFPRGTGKAKLGISMSMPSRFCWPPAARSLLFLLLTSAGAAASAASPGSSVMILANGDRLTGTVIKREHGKIYFHSDVLGDLVAPANQVAIENKPSSSVPSNSLAGLPPAPAKEPEISRAGPGGWWWPWWISRPLLILRPVVTKWSGKVEFGYGNELTTIRTVTTTLRAEAERKVGPDDVLFKGLYLYGRSDGTETTNQDEIDLRWRHNLTQRLFTQTLTTYSSDKIRRLNDDLEHTAAVGYKLFANPRQTLDAGIGMMGQYFDATGVQKGADYLGNSFQDYTYKINGQYTFLEDASIQYSPERRGRFGVVPNLSIPASGATQNYDYKFHATLQGKITEQLSLNLHYDYEYDNAVLDPHSRADQRIATTLGYGF